jgi:hypothetical protein
MNAWLLAETACNTVLAVPPVSATTAFAELQ